MSRYLFSLYFVCPAMAYWLVAGVYYIISNSSIKYRSLCSHTGQNINAPVGLIPVKIVLINQVIITGLFAIVAYDLYQFRVGFSLFSSLPIWALVICQIIVLIICFDSLFYWGHRLLHHPYFFKHIHYVHHQYRNPKPITGSYTHPFEFILTYVLPISVGVVLSGSALWLSSVFIALIYMHNAHDHSCLAFKYDPFLWVGNNNTLDHSLHHQKIHYNFSGGFFDFWDKICKTKIARKP